MDHKNEVNQLLENIIIAGDSMVKIANHLKEILSDTPKETSEDSPKKETPKKSTKKQAEEATAPTYTFTDVRKAFSQKSHEGFTSQVKELISKYGASRLSDIKETDYPALMADLEVIK